MSKSSVSRLNIVVALIMLALAGGGVRSAAAQEALPVTPDPAECLVAPRPLDNLAAVFADATPVAEADFIPGPSETIPNGDAADAQTIAAVTATVRQVIACFNAGDFARVFALFTDEAIAAIFPWMVDLLDDPETVDQIEHPVALAADERQTLVAIANAMVLPNGHAAAFLVLIDPVSDWNGPGVLFLEFAFTGGQWLIAAATEFGSD